MGTLSLHFDLAEAACRCGCGFGTRKEDVSPELVDRLELIRADLGGKPLPVESWCRCHAHNLAVGGVTDSAHTRGTAVDLVILGGLLRFRLVQAALRRGIRGIGIGERFIHLDVDMVLARPSLWGYKARC